MRKWPVILAIACLAGSVRGQNPYVSPAQKAILDLYYMPKGAQLTASNLAPRSITMDKIDGPIPSDMIIEGDPQYRGSPAGGITAGDITRWNNAILADQLYVMITSWFLDFGLNHLHKQRLADAHPDTGLWTFCLSDLNPDTGIIHLTLGDLAP